jgi:phosphinothricin acetyltransferase
MTIDTVGVTTAPLGREHWPDVKRIYVEGIETGDATFETSAPSWDDWNGAHLPDHRFVALDGDEVLGWVAAVAVSDRCVYSGVVEHSVYVTERARGRGIGTLLLASLIASTEAAGVWTIQTGIFPENEPSLRLHERVGFRVVGMRERIGQLNGAWRDVVLLERRSPNIS